MANNRNYAKWIDIPDGHGSTERKWLMDEEAREAIEQLQELYTALTETDVIPCTELPATGEPNTVYRLAGSGSYTDYMYAPDALTTPIPMATFDVAVATESDVRDIVRNYTPS